MSQKQREPPEAYYPHYVDPDEVEFDYAYAKCRCGWESARVGHPSMAEYHLDGHRKFGRTPDCGVGTHVLVFEDGSTAEV